MDRRDYQPRRVTDQLNVSPAWIMEAFDALRRDFNEAHQRLRLDLNEMKDQIRQDIREREQFEIETRQRVDKVITERAVEEKTAKGRTAWIAIAAAAGLNGLIRLAEKLLH